MRKSFKELDRYARRVKKERRSWLHSEMKLLKLCFKYMQRIGYPKNEKDVDRLGELVKVYDQHVALIEKDFISKIREYI